MNANECFESERLYYRPFQMEDAEAMYRYQNEKSRRKWFYFQEPDCLTWEYCVNLIEKNIFLWSRKINILEDHFDFAIVLKETGEYIGNVGVSGADREEADIGYSICEAHQGKGYATEATKAIVEWGFKRLEEMGAELKICAEIEHENLSSRRVAEKAGLKFAYAKQYVSVYEIKR